MSHARFVQVAVLATLLAGSVLGDDKPEPKAEKKSQPPRVTIALPFTASGDTTNVIIVRGQNLTNVTTLRFTNDACTITASITNKTKADVPKDADAKRVGDTQLEVELIAPAVSVAITNWFVVESPDGESEPKPLLILPAGSLVEEKEPNGGFKQAQAVERGQMMLGLIKDAGDVDVFRFEGVKGELIRVEVIAALVGAALDSLVSLHDVRGQILASNDDASGQVDSVLTCRLPKAGSYFVSLTDAHDKAGPTHAYMLRILHVPDSL